MGVTCTVPTQRNSCKFSESDKKKKRKMAMVHPKIQVSGPGPSWPSCTAIVFEVCRYVDLILKLCRAQLSAIYSNGSRVISS